MGSNVSIEPKLTSEKTRHRLLVHLAPPARNNVLNTARPYLAYHHFHPEVLKQHATAVQLRRSQGQITPHFPIKAAIPSEFAGGFVLADRINDKYWNVPNRTFSQIEEYYDTHHVSFVAEASAFLSTASSDSSGGSRGESGFRKKCEDVSAKSALEFEEARKLKAAEDK
jgi:hypothetical protein